MQNQLANNKKSGNILMLANSMKGVGLVERRGRKKKSK